MKCQLISLLLLAAGALPAVPGVTSEFPSGMNVFTQNEPVRFVLPQTSDLQIVNNLGEVIPKSCGKDQVFDFGKLPAGYYRIVAGGTDRGSFTVTLPPEEYSNDKGTAIGLDYAMNTANLPLPGPELRKELERNTLMAQKAGVKRVRERFRANQEITRNADGSFTIDPKGRTMLTLSIDRAAGFAVCAVSQWTPSAINLDGNLKKCPAELNDVYMLYSAIGKVWGPYLEAVELGNEIDLRTFYEGTAGEYAAYAKTASLALRKSAPGLLIVQSSFARPALHLKDAIAQNGLQPYFDVFNYHVYGEIGKNMNDYAHYIMEREKYPRAWCTETGKDVGHWDWNQPGIEDFPPELSRAIARAVGPIFAENLAAGAEVTYFFYWRYGAELSAGSILDKQYRATDRYAALATVNRMLGNAQYRGSKINGALRMHRFDDGRGGRAVIVWSDVATAADIGVKGKYEIVNYTGETIAQGQADDKLSVNLAAGVPVYIKADEFPGSFTDLRRQPPEAEILSAPSAVLELRPEGAIDYDNSLAAFSLKPGETRSVRLTLRNFGSEEYRGEIEFTLSSPWKVTPAKAALVAQPGQSVESMIEVTAPTERNSGCLPQALRADAPRISAAAIRLALDPATVIPRVVRPAFADLNSGVWSCGGDRNQMQFGVTPGTAGPHFKINFTASGNRMFWPELTRLPDHLASLDWGSWDAVRITLQIEQTQPGSWFMLTCTELKGARYASARILADTVGVHQLLFPFSGFSYVTEGSMPDAPLFSFDPDRIRTFGLGSNNLNNVNLKNVNYTVEYEVIGVDLIRY